MQNVLLTGLLQYFVRSVVFVSVKTLNYWIFQKCYHILYFTPSMRAPFIVLDLILILAGLHPLYMSVSNLSLLQRHSLKCEGFCFSRDLTFHPIVPQSVVNSISFIDIHLISFIMHIESWVIQSLRMKLIRTRVNSQLILLILNK